MTKAKPTIVGMILAGLIFAAGAIAAGDRYLCIAEKGVLFKFSESGGAWRGQAGTYDAKYMLRPTEDNEYTDAPYAVFEFGSKHPDLPDYVCQERVSEVLQKNIAPRFQVLRCESGLGHFLFSPNTMRFQIYYRFGYVSDTRSDTPYIIIGTCSSL